jgi:hypothetical protein
MYLPCFMPEAGKRGHVHYVELDQFIGQNYLVTVHGLLNPAVNPEVRSWIPTPCVSGSRNSPPTWHPHSSSRIGSCHR